MLFLLLESALRAAGLALLVGLGLKLFRVRNPHVMLTAWTVVLCAALAMPVLVTVSPVTLVMPQVQADLLDLPALPDVGPNAPEGVAAAIFEQPPLPAFVAGLQWGTILSAAYVAVVIVLAVRLLMACIFALRLWRAARPVEAAWAKGLKVRVSSSVMMPATVGATILLPQDCVTWPTVKRDAVLLHERSHAARGDFYIQLLTKIHTALFWFSPLAWWLEKRLALLSENTSDDAAISKLRDRTAYAEILLDVSRGLRAASMSVAMARPVTVRERIERILSQATVPQPVGWRRHLVIAISLTPMIGVMTSAIALPPQDIPAIRPLTEPVLRLMVQPVVPETVALDADRLLNAAISASVRIYKAVDVIAVPALPPAIPPSAVAVPEIVEAALAPAQVTAPAPAVSEQPCLVLKNIEKMAVADRTTILATTRNGLNARIDLENSCKGFAKFKPLLFDGDKNGPSAARPLKRSDEVCVQDVLEEEKDGPSCAITQITAIDDTSARQLRVRALTGKDFAVSAADETDDDALDRRFLKICYAARMAASYRKACLDAMEAAPSDAEREAIAKVVRAEVKQEQRRRNRGYASVTPDPPSNFGPTPQMGPPTGYSPTR
jgi:beta-lactamase regulating signal transducer with metallopeptidase domain